MKKGRIKFLVIAIVFFPAITIAGGPVRVNGYYKKNGTYVEPHYRSSPNSTPLDNWSTKGNSNPYTGEEGEKNPSGATNNYYGVTPSYLPQSYFSSIDHSTSMPFDGVEVISGDSIKINGKVFKLWGINNYNDNLLCGYTKCVVNAKLYLKWTINNASSYSPVDSSGTFLSCKVINKDTSKAICRINTIDLSAAMLLSGFVYANHDDTDIYDYEYQIGFNKIKNYFLNQNSK